MVGRAVVRHCSEMGDEVAALDRKTLDISDPRAVGAAFDLEAPAVVINCAAATNVDACELDPQRAELANTRGPQLLAEECCRHDALLITISTDYVFDGMKSGFYTQRDQPNPQSVYGKAKLEGERRAQNACARTIVVRSGFIFGQGGSNFLSTCLTRIRNRESLRVISDMVGTPTYADDLARRLRELALLDLPGTYHVSNAGDGASFFDFVMAAGEIVDLEPDATPVTLASLRLPAPRPRNSRLRCLLSEHLGLATLPDWRAALATFAGA